MKCRIRDFTLKKKQLRTYQVRIYDVRNVLFFTLLMSTAVCSQRSVVRRASAKGLRVTSLLYSERCASTYNEYYKCTRFDTAVSSGACLVRLQFVRISYDDEYQVRIIPYVLVSRTRCSIHCRCVLLPGTVHVLWYQVCTVHN